MPPSAHRAGPSGPGRTHPPGAGAGRTRRFVAFALSRGRWLWAAALLLALPAFWRTGHLYANLRSEIEQLLPARAPSVLAIDELRSRMPGLQYLGVLVDAGPNPPAARLDAAERFLDALATRVAKYPPELVGGVRTGFAPERAFVDRFGPLLVSLPDLRLIHDRIQARVRYEYAKQQGTLFSDDGPPPLDFADIEARYGAQAGGGGFRGDRFTNAHLGTSLMLIETGGFSTDAGKDARLLSRVRDDVRALGGTTAFAPGLALGFTGDVAISVEETQALVSDLTWSSLLVVGAVIAVLLLYFRWWGAVPALLAPLLLATGYTFALANLLGVRELNSNTAFLGSIIVGNGINFGVIQLGRYVEARRRGRTVRDALEVSLLGTRAGTLSAALAAGIAYASLMAMQFRGFRQFGVIGGLGMVLCWMATFLLGPPLLAALDRGRLAIAPIDPSPGRATGGARWGLRRLGIMNGLVGLVSRGRVIIVVLAALLTVLAVAQARRFGRDQIEFDFSRLRRADTWARGEGFWGHKMDRLLGRYLTPTVLLTDSPEQSAALAVRLRKAVTQPPLDQMVASVRTFADLVPSDQAARRAEWRRIRALLTPAVRADLEPALLARVDRAGDPGATEVITAHDVPDTLTKGLLERDGDARRAVLIFPKPTQALWNGPQNEAFVARLRQVAEEVARQSGGGRPARVAGGPPLTADIVASMYRDGPFASELALAGVVLSVILLFRRRVATPFVIGGLLVGVLWLLGAAMALRIKINFVNFIAFPITFGIGVDYAVNVMGRYLADGGRDILGAVRGTGGAVALCSATTIIGYSSLLLAQNRGLFSFGLLAVLGEVTCLAVALVVLPATVLLALRRR